VEIRRMTMALTEALIDEARAAGLRPRVAARPEERTGIVMLPREDPARDIRHLAEARIVADYRPGHVRLSPYFYNIPDDNRAAIERLTRD
jgi:kynureninase